MARLLLRLRLRLVANTLSRGLQAVLGLLFGALFGIGGGVLVAVWLGSSSASTLWADAVVVALATVWVGWLLLPMLSFSSDDTLDPRVLAWLPHNRTTAVAARFLRSLIRDPRVRTQAMSQAFIVVPMLAISVGSMQGDSAPLIATFLVVPFGLIAANQYGLEGPALWQHRLAGEHPRSDILGRNIALGTLGLPLAAVAAVVVSAVFGTWALPVVLLLSLATLLSLLGVSNAASVAFPYPVPEDASNPFASNAGAPGAGCVQGLLVLVTLLAHGLLSVPLVLAAVLPDTVGGRTAASAGAVLYGVGIFAVGTTLAVRGARSRGPELLAAVDPRRQ
ncbi:MAG: hypothetical protein WD378_07910 [Egicoccus sp.]